MQPGLQSSYSLEVCFLWPLSHQHKGSYTYLEPSHVYQTLSLAVCVDFVRLKLDLPEFIFAKFEC